MTIYSINKSIGWSSSGVEYAQVYRAKLFRNLGIKFKFIFTDFITENIGDLAENIGFRTNEILWLYTYFTDFSISKSTFRLSEFQNSISGQILDKTREGKIIRYSMKDNTYAIAHLLDTKSDIIKSVEFGFENKILKRDFYSYKKYMTEYYRYQNEKKIPVRRTFYNTNGTVAYFENLYNNGSSLYSFNGNIVMTKESLISLMIKNLKLTRTDLVLIDRATGIVQAVVENKNTAKLGCIIHAEHFNEQNTNDQHILWNNFYEYQLEHSDLFDFFITATDIQKRIILNQLQNYKKVKCKIYSIPVGSITHLKRNISRKNSFITVSRLAKEKHIDWLVIAFIKAHSFNSDITLDIYGEGAERKKIQKIIDENEASNFIKLKGHRKMLDIYQHYSVYVSASTSEGFGLTLMEALGCGLAFIGFNVRYGNQNFIKNNKNGLLIEYSIQDTDELSILNLSQAINQLSATDLSDYSRFSYKLAEAYLYENVKDQWSKLLKKEHLL
ncbi:accessory Sec system glycosyltransferase GtfA [Pediococcus pentosaceus]|uniref:accessory Sec system glycosyltransferase GtfA n=1 Tax=Pediococcus pentosaceus TaxID=1255 RepID=UPI001912FE66|nr:accessory Sec system glycosyltransferase GtfA [Pediococcus pentosaceus]